MRPSGVKAPFPVTTAARAVLEVLTDHAESKGIYAGVPWGEIRAFVANRNHTTIATYRALKRRGWIADKALTPGVRVTLAGVMALTARPVAVRA